MKKRYMALAAALAVSSAAAVVPASATAATKKGPVQSATIAYVSAGMQYTYYQALYKGIQYEAHRLGIPKNHVLVYSDNGDANQEINNIQAAISKHVSLIIDTAVNIPTGLRDAALAKKAGIPIVAADRYIGPQVKANIQSNNVNGGYRAGVYLARALKGSGAVVEITGTLGTSNVIDRTNGFNKALKKFPHMTVYPALDGNFDPGKAVSAMEDALAAHPNLRGVFVQADIMLAPICKLLKSRHINNITTIGFDGDPVLYSCLRDGYATASIGQAPAFIGEKAVAVAARVLRHQAVKNKITSPIGIVTKKKLPCFLGWTDAPLKESVRLFKPGCGS